MSNMHPLAPPSKAALGPKRLISSEMYDQMPGAMKRHIDVALADAMVRYDCSKDQLDWHVTISGGSMAISVKKKGNDDGMQGQRQG